MKADGKCGKFNSEPKPIEKSSELVKWKPEKINPEDTENSTDLEFNIYTQQESDLYQEYAFIVEMKPVQTLYPTRSVSIMIRIISCFVMSTYHYNQRETDFYLSIS